MAIGPVIRFLQAARNMAKQGMKKEQILDFARREFGKVSELLKRQIDDIYSRYSKPATGGKKPGEVVPIKRKPIDPDDALPNYKETPGAYSRRITPGTKENLLEQLKIVYRKRYNNLRGDETAEELKKIIEQAKKTDVPFGSSGSTTDDLLDLSEPSDTDMLRKGIEQLESLKAPGASLDPVTGLTRTLARRILDRKGIQIDKNDPLDVFNDIFGESIIDVKDLAEEMLEIDRRGGGIKNIDQMLEADGLFDIKIPQNPNRGIPNDELLEILKKDLNEKELITTKVPQKSEYQKTIESISALDNDINRRVMKKELKREFPGITDTMIEDILMDADPQRIAEVKQTMREALEMQSKGMSFDEIVDIFKKTTRRKQATGGRVKMAKGGLPNILGF